MLKQMEITQRWQRQQCIKQLDLGTTNYKVWTVLYSSTEDNTGKAKWDACSLNTSPLFNVPNDITGARRAKSRS
jgi:hypothetical protein